MSVKAKPAEERLWRYVKKTDTCWLWTGALQKGYGRLGYPNHTFRAAHRIAYELMIGPIPDGMTLDHLCRNRACVNPDHLEPVTPRENVLRGIGHCAQNARKNHCPQGHAYDLMNTRVHPRLGWRKCRACERERREAKRLAEVVR